MRHAWILVVYVLIILGIGIALIFASAKAQEYVPWQVINEAEPDHRWELYVCSHRKNQLAAAGFNLSQAIYNEKRGWCISLGIGSQIDFVAQISKAISDGLSTILVSVNWKNHNMGYQDTSVCLSGMRHYCSAANSTEVASSSKTILDEGWDWISGLGEDLQEVQLWK